MNIHNYEIFVVVLFNLHIFATSFSKPLMIVFLLTCHFDLIFLTHICAEMYFLKKRGTETTEIFVI